jgi:hypothetical protein
MRQLEIKVESCMFLESGRRHNGANNEREIPFYLGIKWTLTDPDKVALALHIVPLCATSPNM